MRQSDESHLAKAPEMCRGCLVVEPRTGNNNARIVSLPVRLCALHGSGFVVDSGIIIEIAREELSVAFSQHLQTGTIVTVEFNGCVLAGEIRDSRRVPEYRPHLKFVVSIEVRQVIRGDQCWQRLTGDNFAA